MKAINNRAMKTTKEYGMSAFTILSNGTPDMVERTNATMPKGGVVRPSIRVTLTMMPK